MHLWLCIKSHTKQMQQKKRNEKEKGNERESLPTFSSLAIFIAH